MRAKYVLIPLFFLAGFCCFYPNITEPQFRPGVVTINLAKDGIDQSRYTLDSLLTIDLSRAARFNANFTNDRIYIRCDEGRVPENDVYFLIAYDVDSSGSYQLDVYRYGNGEFIMIGPDDNGDTAPTYNVEVCVFALTGVSAFDDSLPIYFFADQDTTTLWADPENNLLDIQPSLAIPRADFDITDNTQVSLEIQNGYDHSCLFLNSCSYWWERNLNWDWLTIKAERRCELSWSGTTADTIKFFMVTLEN